MPSPRTIELPSGPFDAYLFDCDGTIADSMPLHYVAWKKVLDEWNCPFPEDLFYAWGGIPPAEIIPRLNKLHNLAIPIEETTARKEALYYELFPQLEPVHEVLEHIHASHGKVPFAVVSGSPRESVVASLETLGLLDLFDTLICAEDYVKGKPDPEPFLIAAMRLNVDPRRCLVFEDTDLGIESATKAGMASVRVLQPWQR
jgi:HAD superfamily hydrolase (TIGR01509 family)